MFLYWCYIKTSIVQRYEKFLNILNFQIFTKGIGQSFLEALLFEILDCSPLMSSTWSRNKHNRAAQRFFKPVVSLDQHLLSRPDYFILLPNIPLIVSYCQDLRIFSLMTSWRWNKMETWFCKIRTISWHPICYLWCELCDCTLLLPKTDE